MTDFWLVAMAIAAVAGLWIAFPFLGRRTIETNAAEGAISIYRDQMDEVERDTAAGLISNEEGEAARAEIERRALKAARSLDGGLAISKRAPVIALLLTVVAGGAALGVYGAIGSPNAPDQPLAERRAEALERQAEAGDLGSKIQILIDRTKENPESFEDWWMLARSYSAVGDNASAADAYRNAVELSDDRPSVLSAYAEAMTLANGNKVPSAAKVIFQQLAVENADPRARYYVALAKAQEQDFEGAIQGWAELNRDSEPNAPWVAVVRRDIVNMARFLKTDVATYLPDATPDELAAAGGPGLLPESGTTDLAALEARTASDPKDYEAWIELANARAANGDSDGAAADIAEAKRQFAGAPFLLSKFNELERRLGLDLVALDAGPKGPTTEDMAAAAEMTQEDRDDMIAGMVAGLAARLDEQPNDPEGWAMLIRSYQTLGDAERAETALERATGLFKGTEAYQVILDTR